MNAKFSKRLISFIIDFIFITSILMIIKYFIDKIDDTFIINNISDVTEKYLEGNISFLSFLKVYSIYLYDLDHQNSTFNLINYYLLFGYYVLTPIITNGYTLGKYIMKIKITKKDGKKLNILNTFIRSCISEGGLYLIISILSLNLIDAENYLFILIIFGFIQFLLVIISGFMILYKKDKQGLQDILSRTYVTNKEVKE